MDPENFVRGPDFFKSILTYFSCMNLLAEAIGRVQLLLDRGPYHKFLGNL